MNIDKGLLILRVGLGLMFMYYGLPKLLGGPKAWADLGAIGMGNLGISFFPALWGFLAASAMGIGGICVVLGIFFRPACILITLTMLVAANMHLRQGQGFLAAAHAIDNAIVFFSLFFIGPGRLTIPF